MIDILALFVKALLQQPRKQALSVMEIISSFETPAIRALSDLKLSAFTSRFIY